MKREFFSEHMSVVRPRPFFHPFSFFLFSVRFLSGYGVVWALGRVLEVVLFDD